MLFFCLLTGVAFGQNIQINTASTTVGSRTFGFDISPSQLQTVMQSAGLPDCDASHGVDGVMTCTLGNYVKAPGMPGSFTGNPFKTVWSEADFGCGIPCSTFGGADPQTAPQGFEGPNTPAGTVTSTVDLGLGFVPGDPFHAAGHVTFAMDPSTMSVLIDQQILQEINTGSGLTIAFTETDSALSFTSIADSDVDRFTGPVDMITGMILTKEARLVPRREPHFTSV
ncbi:hypothetical protein [Candidatus Manganitrophus noduliformans]|uniref:Uncharacterized protein n=1 Tax=Candidatus Manganitrophus noduliformans TaxID=2606439 RepID=A0A7X6DUP0_9BACT|nr:hypothetical protein [Candidatus Manganitrophus noduliformans]NKE73738.1 hypothetical protein [Candidatus Manganitrophus noduliformans]